MTMLTGSCSADVPAGIEECWAVLADVDSWPSWQRMLSRMQVIERDDQDRPLVCEAVIDAKLLRVGARVRVLYERPRRLSYELVEAGDHLDALEGSWTLEPLQDGRTRANYELALDPGPMGLLGRRLERAIRPVVMGHQAAELAAEVARRG